ncbi:universal stress protein A-like protein isoform X1 [Papaver somniferum]|uniref:universal stress protein A-like protein isoform X1 n=1 Tax=Papaver somniferum TaxID=3469 RepID=UPI000E6FB26A|nr:universal stress protein A-like protein isoform X1 [Papaver somniferum]
MPNQEALCLGTIMADIGAVQERKIVVAIDEGEESIYALTWAIKNVVSQNSSNDTIILLYAKPQRAVYSTLDGPGDKPNKILFFFPYISHISNIFSNFLIHFVGNLFSSDVIMSMEKYSKEVADCVIEKAKRVCKDLQNVKVETMIESGDAREVICDAVEKIGADLLVMGTHGYGVIKRAFLGSVSTHCAQNVKCPVLIVKKPKSS